MSRAGPSRPLSWARRRPTSPRVLTCLSLRVSASEFPLLRGHQSYWIRATVVVLFQLDYFFKDPTSKYSHISRSWVSRLRHRSLGDTAQSVAPPLAKRFFTQSWFSSFTPQTSPAPTACRAGPSGGCPAPVGAWRCPSWAELPLARAQCSPGVRSFRTGMEEACMCLFVQN